MNVSICQTCSILTKQICDEAASYGVDCRGHKVDLTNKNLTKLPNFVRGMGDRVYTLILDYNPNFEGLPDWIDELHNLRDLQMIGCGIFTFPDNVFTLAKMQRICIGDSVIRIPVCFDSDSTLKDFNDTDCKIKYKVYNKDKYLIGKTGVDKSIIKSLYKKAKNDYTSSDKQFIDEIKKEELKKISKSSPVGVSFGKDFIKDDNLGLQFQGKGALFFYSKMRDKLYKIVNKANNNSNNNNKQRIINDFRDCTSRFPTSEKNDSREGLIAIFSNVKIVNCVFGDVDNSHRTGSSDAEPKIVNVKNCFICRMLDTILLKLDFLDSDILANLNNLSPAKLAALKLKYLHAVNMQLEKEFGSLRHLTGLYYFDLGYNKLFAIPTTIQNFKNLRILSAARNSIANIPNWVGDMKLKSINLYHQNMDLGLDLSEVST